MKAGMNMRSAKLSQRSFAISEVSTEAAGLRPRDKLAQLIRRIDDIGIGEEEVVRRLRRRFGGLDALVLRPQLAGPSGRQRAPGR